MTVVANLILFQCNGHVSKCFAWNAVLVVLLTDLKQGGSMKHVLTVLLLVEPQRPCTLPCAFLRVATLSPLDGSADLHRVDRGLLKVLPVRTDAPLWRRHPPQKRCCQARRSGLDPPPSSPSFLLVWRISDDHGGPRRRKGAVEGHPRLTPAPDPGLSPTPIREPAARRVPPQRGRGNPGGADAPPGPRACAARPQSFSPWNTERNAGPEA